MRRQNESCGGFNVFDLYRLEDASDSYNRYLEGVVDDCQGVEVLPYEQVRPFVLLGLPCLTDATTTVET